MDQDVQGRGYDKCKGLSPKEAPEAGEQGQGGEYWEGMVGGKSIGSRNQGEEMSSSKA